MRHTEPPIGQISVEACHNLALDALADFEYADALVYAVLAISAPSQEEIDAEEKRQEFRAQRHQQAAAQERVNRLAKTPQEAYRLAIGIPCPNERCGAQRDGQCINLTVLNRTGEIIYTRWPHQIRTVAALDLIDEANRLADQR